MSRAMKKYFKKTVLERGKDCNQTLACWIDILEAHSRYAVEKGDELARDKAMVAKRLAVVALNTNVFLFLWESTYGRYTLIRR